MTGSRVVLVLVAGLDTINRRPNPRCEGVLDHFGVAGAVKGVSEGLGESGE